MSERQKVDELLKRICNDLKSMGLEVRLPIILRPFSKTLWGYYEDGKIVLYIYRNKNRKQFIHYNILFRTILHEYVHALQRKSSVWKRYKGTMHDTEFWKIYNNLTALAVERGIIYGKSER